MIVHEKKYEAIDQFDTDHWAVDEQPDGAIYTVKPGAPNQDITITRPSGGTQDHNGLKPGSSVKVNRVTGTVVVTAA